MYRVLKEGAFVIISNSGYFNIYVDNFKIMGPNDDQIITSEMIKKLSENIGFEIKEIPLDENLLQKAIEVIKESFHSVLHKNLKIEIKSPYALFLEK